MGGIATLLERFEAKGHPNVTAKHETTLEVTTEDWLTQRGDCVVAVESEKSCADLTREAKRRIREGSTFHIWIETEGFEERIVATGSPSLELSSSEGMVVRKSDYSDYRTLGIEADKAAADIDRGMVAELKRQESVVVRLEFVD